MVLSLNLRQQTLNNFAQLNALYWRHHGNSHGNSLQPVLHSKCVSLCMRYGIIAEIFNRS